MFENVSYLDGAALAGPATVGVEDGLISAVGEGASYPDGAEVIDGAGLMAVIFSATEPGDFAFQLDDVTFEQATAH